MFGPLWPSLSSFPWSASFAFRCLLSHSWFWKGKQQQQQQINLKSTNKSEVSNQVLIFITKYDEQRTIASVYTFTQRQPKKVVFFFFV